jgi:gamma-glutamyltranspeptidase/glutathione hydrolase
MNFVKVPVQQLSKEYGDKRRALIDLDKSGTYQAGKVSHTGTVYMTDKEGNISLIQSNGMEWFLPNWALCYKIEGNYLI